MITVQNLTKYFGHCQALKDVSFKINKGDIVGFLGPNGAGKTTLMRILTTFLPATAGKVDIGGLDVDKDASSVVRKIGYLPEIPPLYPKMNVRNYLKFSAELKEIPPRQQKAQVDRVLEACQLQQVDKVLIDNLSKGFKQRVGIAQAMVSEPEILILDEPTSGLDPIQRQQVLKLIKSLEHERTVIVSTHNLFEIEQIAQRVIIIKSGEIIADDSLEHLVTDQDTGVTTSLEEVFLRKCVDE